MYDSLFAMFLFVVVFSSLCWIVTPVSAVAAEMTTAPETLETADTTHKVFDTNVTQDAEIEVPKLQQVFSDDGATEGELQEIMRLAIDTLQLRQARRIAGKLKIRQKVNGRDQPLSWLKAQIRTAWEKNPDAVGTVINEVVNQSPTKETASKTTDTRRDQGVA